MASLSGTLSRDQSWNAWSGTVEDLRQVLATIERQYEPLRASHIADRSRYEQQRVRTLQGYLDKAEEAQATADDEYLARSAERDILRYTEELEVAKAELDKRKQEAEADLNLQLGLFDGKSTSQRYVGGAADLAEVAGDSFVFSADFEAPSGMLSGYRVTFNLARGSGAKLTVYSTDERWARAAFSAIADQVGKYVPRWQYLRSPRVALTALWGAFAIGGILGTIGLARALELSPSSTSALGFAMLVVVILLPLLIYAILERVVPGAEVLRGGRSSQGGAVWAFFGSSGVAIALGLLVNFIS